MPFVEAGSRASSAGVGFAFSAMPNSWSVVCRLRRVSCCSEVSSWSNWTGVAVWSTGIVSPSEIVGAAGVPGSRSTKKLPSRKMRGRIFSSASLWIGSPASFISIVMTALFVPSWPSIFFTVPTFTPAMRTGEFSRIEFADGKTALNSKPRENGRFFVKPR